MPGLLSKLLGARVAPTSANIGENIAAHETALAKARGVVAAAAQARADALDSLDADGMARADEASAAGGRAVEVEERVLSVLADAHAKAIDAEQAAAKVAARAVLVERRRLLGLRLESEYRDAAAVMASILSSIAELRRDIVEAGFSDRDIDRLPEVDRGLRMQTEAVANVSTFLGDALAFPPTVTESPAEAAFRVAQARRDREKAEAAEARRARAEAEEGRAAREAERQAEAERGPYYGSGWRDALSDTAR